MPYSLLAVPMPRSAVTLALVFLAAAPSAAGRQTPQQAPPVFRAGTELVQLDVTVLDHDRHPVHGLTADDFVVLEDGKPRPVAACSAIDVPAPEASGAAWTRDIAPDVVSNDLHAGRLLVIVFDDALIPFHPLYARTAKDIVKQIVDKMGPNDMAAFVATADNRTAQDFTHDRARLLAAVDKISPGIASYTFGHDVPPVAGQPSVVMPNTDTHFYQQTVETLRATAEFLAAVPNQRKALIYVGPGVPIDPESVGPQLVSGTGKGTPDLEANRALLAQLQETIRQAQRANVTFYPIDPTGTAGIESFVLGVLTSRQAPEALDLSHKVAVNDLDFVQTIAADTGGFAVVSHDDPSAGIAQMFEETGSYYLLGFPPGHPEADGTLRRVTVKVNRPGLDVHVRSSYAVPSAPKDAAERSPLAEAIGGLLSSPAVPMDVTLAPFADPKPNAKTNPVAIVLGLWESANHVTGVDHVDDNVELQASAFTPEGESRATERLTATVTLNTSATAPGRLEVLAQLALKPGRYRVRLAAHSSLQEKTGSVFADVEVPDFAALPLSMSGVLIESANAPISAPPDALASLIDFTPTSLREFPPGSASAFVRLYEGSHRTSDPVHVTSTITNAEGAVVRTYKTEYAAGDFSAAAHAVDLRVKIDPQPLDRGLYLLSIVAEAGKTTIRRDIRFAIH